MKVAVIGAGPSGLTTIKQLLDEDHEVLCFERDDDLGGIWYRHEGDGDGMRVFDSLLLTISMKLMAYSDLPHEGDRTFTDHRGYLRYLHRYADEFGLREHIQFKTNVEDIRKQGEGWQVTVTTPQGERVEHTVGAVALCTGPFQTPNETIPEIEGFDGPVHHSYKYRNAESYAGKRVLVLGLAESGADVVREISDVAAECTLSIRSYSFLLPRLFRGRYSTDMRTFRAHHHEMYVRATRAAYPLEAIWGEGRAAFLAFVSLYGLATAAWLRLVAKLSPPEPDDPAALNNLGEPLHPLKLDVHCENTQAHVDAINEWNRKSHKGEGNWSQRVIFCKNVSFIPNVVNGKIELKDCGIESVEGKQVRFEDSTVREYDEIVLCTGFIKDFSVLGDVEITGGNVRNLYKHAFHPDHGGRLAVIGLIRPFSGGIPVCSEMQARYFAQVCSGKLHLPHDVVERIEREKAWEELWTNLSPRHDEALPSQIFFMDSMAREIGCLMPAHELILNPRLAVKQWFGAFNQASYRLVGPHATPERARRDLLAERLPSDDPMSIVRLTKLLFKRYSVHPKNINMRL